MGLNDVERPSGEEDEEDYMSMILPEPNQTIGKETSIQRAARKKRESEARSRQKTKKERERDEELAREAALASSLDATNKGFKMMAKLGYKPGNTLGKATDARTEPLHLSMKIDRGGIGMDSEKKRKMRETLESTEQETKKVKVDLSDYRERVGQEREEKRLEGQVKGAQKVTEQLDTEAYEENLEGQTPLERRPLKNVNVLYRSLIRARREKEAYSKMKSEVQKSLTYRTDYNDSDEEEEEKSSNPKRVEGLEFFEEDLEEEDVELDEFDELDSAGKLARIVSYLRGTYFYCFWCKTKYPDAQMEGCPGLTEADHE